MTVETLNEQLEIINTITKRALDKPEDYLRPASTELDICEQTLRILTSTNRLSPDEASKVKAAISKSREILHIG